MTLTELIKSLLSSKFYGKLEITFKNGVPTAYCKKETGVLK